MYKVGHLARECWLLKKENNTNRIICFNCNKEGHIAKDCRQKEAWNKGNNEIKNNGTSLKNMKKGYFQIFTPQSLKIKMDIIILLII